MMITFTSFFSLEKSKDLEAGLAELPLLTDSNNQGTFVKLVKAIDDVYTDGKIHIRVYPFKRSVQNVIDGVSDFHIPSIRNSDIDQTKLPYNTVKVPMGRVCFVIYSSKNRPVTKKMLDNAIAKKGRFPYIIEIARGIEDQFPFNGNSINDIEQSLKKVSAGRIDALVWAQEEVDYTLKKLKLKNIRRDYWMYFEDVIIIQKSPRGDRINKLLSDALLKLKKEGRLQKIHYSIHHNFENWQP